MGPRLLVVADDLTGAHDCAARLTSLGGPVPAARRASFLRASEGAPALVLDAETRFLGPRAARWRSAQAWGDLARIATAPWRFQKLDSTLRGNPGEEIEGMLLASAAPWVAVLPAYPRAGRMTLRGRHWVHGVPLERTEFAQDPLTPARVKRPQDLFEPRLSLHAPLAWVAGGARRLTRELERAFHRKQPRFVTFDCASDAHVLSIARACVQRGCRHFAGASAFAGALAQVLGAGADRPAKPPTGLPWIFLAGSVSERSFDQLKRAQDDGALHWATLDRLPRLPVLRRAQRQGPLALSTLASRKGIGPRREGEAAIRALVATGLKLVSRPAKAAWFLTGGHCAQRFFDAAGFQRFDVYGEVLPGLALGQAVGPQGSAWCATKPGGFGDVDLIPHFLELVRAR